MSSPCEPRISVVVPIHDVEPYLAACLDSVLAQGIDDLEVLCIDDGSRDGGPELAAAYARSDPRLRLLRQANAGLGATRNRGAELARGTYLAFLDSDDVLPPGAYLRLLAAIERSGADLVVGDVRRLTTVGVRRSPTFSPIYRPARRDTHVSRDPALLRDRIAPNKLYRRDFWQANGLRFPTGVLFEDTPVTLRAHVLARSVEVLADPVYLWRVRAGADRSITQRRLEPRALRDRVAAVSDVSEFLRARDPDLARVYDQLALTDDLRLFAAELDRADDAYRAQFLALAGDLLARTDPSALDDAPALERTRWHLVAAGDLDGLVELARRVRIDPLGAPPRSRRGGYEAVLPLTDAPQRVPQGCRRLGPELALDAGLAAVALEDTGKFVLTGWASIAALDVASERDQRLRLWLEHVDTGSRLRLRVRPQQLPPEVPVSGRADRSGAGFRVTIDPAELARRWQRGTDRWRLHAEVRVGRLRRSGPVRAVAAGRARRPPAVEVGELRVGPRVDLDAVDLVVVARPVRVTELGLDPSGHLLLELVSRRALRTLRLSRLGVADRHVTLCAAGAERFRATIDPALVTDGVPAVQGTAGAERHANLHALDDAGRVARLSVDDGVESVLVADRDTVVRVERSRYAYASLRATGPVLWLTGTTPAGTDRGGGLVLRGRLYGAPSALGAGLLVSAEADDRHDPRHLDVEVAADGGVQVVLPTDLGPGVPPGSAGLRAQLPSTDATAEPVPVVVAMTAALIAQLPVPLADAARPVRFDDRSWQRPALVVADVLPPEQRGPAGQHRSWRAACRDAGTGRRRRLDGGVVVLAPGGSTAGCPRAVVDELRRRAPSTPVRWGVLDAADRAPEGAEAVVIGTRAWFDALARAAVVLAGAPLPPAFVRHPDQRVLRLWSGVPVRPLGRRAPGVRGAEQPADAARAWSQVVAAGPAAAAALVDAFDLDLAPMVAGLPRHDVLDDPAAAAARRRSVRARLRLAADEPAVLHLPTWVDAARHPGGALRRSDDLDLPALHRALAAAGDATPRLLVKTHPDVVDTWAELDRCAGLDDVRGVEDITGLLLAADVVVAHPSSVVLEAVRAGRPVVLHEPAGYGLAEQLGSPGVDLAAVARPVAVTHDPPQLVAALLDALAQLPADGGLDALAATDPARHLEVVGRDAAAALADRC